MVLRSLKLLITALAVLGVMAVLGIIFGWLMQVPQVAPLLAILAAIALLVLVAVLVTVTAAARRRRATAVLSYLEQAIRLNLPLPRIVRAIGEGETGRFARDMSDAERSLQEGAPLAVVLASVPQIPGRVLALVAAAERAGRLPQVLSRLMKQRRAAIVRSWDSIPFYRVYPLILGLVVIGVGAMLVIFVAPKFEQIFKDFRTPLPEVTRMSLQFARDSGPWIALLAMLMLCWLILSTVASRWRGSAFGLVENPIDWLVNRLPWIRRVRAYRALGDVVEFASDGVAEGRPLDATLLEAAQITANSRVREQIENWVAQMSRGRTLADAARDAGLPRLVSSMLATAQQTPDVAEVFRFLGRYYSTRFSRAAAILQAALIPVMVILMGCVVAWMELSVLLPLMRLVDRMSPYPTGM